MKNNDAQKLKDLMKQLDIEIGDEKIVSSLGLYLDDNFSAIRYGLPLEEFNSELFKEIYEGKKLSGFCYKEYDTEKQKYISDIRVLAGEKDAIKSKTELKENDIMVDSSEKIFEIIAQMKRHKEEKENINPIVALKSAIAGTTSEQIKEAISKEQTKEEEKGEQLHNGQ